MPPRKNSEKKTAKGSKGDQYMYYGEDKFAPVGADGTAVEPTPQAADDVTSAVEPAMTLLDIHLPGLSRCPQAIWLQHLTTRELINAMRVSEAWRACVASSSHMLFRGIRVDANADFTDNSCHALIELAQGRLATLHVRNARLSSRGLRSLHHQTSLRTLSLEGCLLHDTVSGLDLLQILPSSLLTLDLRSSRGSAVGPAQIMRLDLARPNLTLLLDPQMFHVEVPRFLVNNYWGR